MCVAACSFFRKLLIVVRIIPENLDDWVSERSGSSGEISRTLVPVMSGFCGGVRVTSTAFQAM